MGTLTESLQELAAQAPADRAKSISAAMDALPPTEKATVTEAFAVKVLAPDDKTNSRVWLIVVWSFAIAMLLAVAVLGLGYFIAPVTNGTKSDTLITVFTTVTAFLAGLFAPSPVKKAGA